jgi:hypothetical protein
MITAVTELNNHVTLRDRFGDYTSKVLVVYTV